MTRCVEFYTRWKKDPNWCHKCKNAVDQIESYIDLVDGLEKKGIPQESTMVRLPERIARPLIAIQDEEIKENAIQHVENLLKRETPTGGAYNEKITKGDVDQIIQKVSNVHFMSETEEWYTPKEIIDSVLEVLGEIDLDPCGNNKSQSTVPANKYFTKEEDGLTKSWDGTVYMNPPYGGEIKDWIIKLLDEWESGNTIEAIALVPARTDTDWFYRIDAHPWCAIRGRLKFSNHKNSAPFPSAVFYLGSEGDIEGIERFFKVFSKHGTIFQRM